MKERLHFLLLIVATIIGHTSFSQTTFSYTGSVQSYIVPPGVTSIQIEAWGGQGGSVSGYTTQTGALGGYVTADVIVTPGETLEIYVGGQGGDGTVGVAAGGWNGGGSSGNTTNANWSGAGGGGASDVRQGGSTLTDRIVVAGGGGGAHPVNGNSGGVGGGLTGGSATSGSNGCIATYSSGGSQIAGGASCTGTASCCFGTATPPAALGIGADGAGPATSCNDNDSGSGGGGGYYGGGGGFVYCAGGGGSSYTVPSATNVSHSQGVRSGNGEVIITVLTVSPCGTAAPLLTPATCADPATTVTGSTVGLTAPTEAMCGTSMGTGGAAWYTFTGDGNTFEMNTCTGTTYNSKIWVYEGTCGTLNCVTGNDDSCGLQSSVTFATTPGLTYYVVVGGSGSDEGTYVLEVNTLDTSAPTPDVATLSDTTAECGFTPTAPTATDDCSGVITGTPDVTFPLTAEGTTVVTWTYDDGSGNTSTQTQNVIISGLPITVSMVDDTTMTADQTGDAYQWIDCGNGNQPMSGETNQTFEVNANGDYAVIVTMGSCSDTSQCITIDYIGIEELTKASDLTIYPNPSENGEFMVNVDGAIFSIEIIDMLGRTVDASVNKTTGAVDAHELLPGKYIVRAVTMDDRVLQGTIVIQR